VIGSSTALVITEFVLPSNSWRGIGSTGWVWILYLLTNEDSIKQWVDPESTKAFILWFGIRDDNKLTTREFGDKRAEALILTSPNVQTDKESLLGINLIACTQRSFYVDGL
jgi:hypothetical protein